MIRLADLVRRLGGRCELPDAGPTIWDVHLDSRRVGVGDLFVALPGASADGAGFVSDAVARGAVAVLAPSELDLRGVPVELPGLDVVQWVHPDARRAAGLAAAAVCGEPAQHLAVCGITGTNGKTTTAHILGHLLEHSGRAPAVLGTAGHRLSGGRALEASHTTPDAPELHRLFRLHRLSGGDCVVMEASSHALLQERTAGIDFTVAVFTNLTRDHLDYHGDMPSYVRAKARLFEQLGPYSAAVLNADDPMWETMAEAAREQGARVVTYSTRSDSDLRAARLSTDLQGSRFVLDGMGIFSKEMRLPLRGRYNVENALAAAAAARLMGASPSDVSEGLATTSAAPGRLEPIPTGSRGFELYVDYAHTPDALERVLVALREDLDAREADGDPSAASQNRGRLIVVFGCGGDRDAGKRPEMGHVATRLADVAIVTSDNPRGEAPERIVAQILDGVEPGAPAEPLIEVDRRRAIQRAVEVALPGDVVLVAGKGHERGQVIQGCVVAFDDRVVAKEVLS
ncbi:MAG: UDP-N-acetylmuramoyl-L-alanyl-D-glutamate--2,6-diaminopimelate ligase [bacterium]|nr:UDP-N-acetylmuramoyl-L-alanyl-D-glutamate--2,6-diaminopimelate ligase [bacterium]